MMLMLVCLSESEFLIHFYESLMNEDGKRIGNLLDCKSDYILSILLYCLFASQGFFVCLFFFYLCRL